MNNFNLKIQGGKLFFETEEKKQNFWYLFNREIGKCCNGKYQMSIERIKSKRSDNQNRYYWGAVLPEISAHTGHTIDELHEIFKRLFLPPIVVKYRGRDIKMPRSTTKLGKGDFVEYIMRISAEAGQLGITLPDPEDYFQSQFK